MSPQGTPGSISDRDAELFPEQRVRLAHRKRQKVPDLVLLVDTTAERKAFDELGRELGTAARKEPCSTSGKLGRARPTSNPGARLPEWKTGCERFEPGHDRWGQVAAEPACEELRVVFELFQRNAGSAADRQGREEKRGELGYARKETERRK